MSSLISLRVVFDGVHFFGTEHSIGAKGCLCLCRSVNNTGTYRQGVTFFLSLFANALKHPVSLDPVSPNRGFGSGRRSD